MEKLFFACCGLMVLMTPADIKIKLPLAAVCATPGLFATIGGYRRYKDSQTKIEELQQEADDIRARNVYQMGDGQLEVSRLLSQANDEKRRILAEVQKEKERMLAIVETKTNEVEAMRSQILLDQQEIENLKKKIKDDTDAIEVLRAEAETERVKARMEGLKEAAATNLEEMRKVQDQFKQLSDLDAQIKNEQLAWAQAKQKEYFALEQAKVENELKTQKLEAELTRLKEEREAEWSEQFDEEAADILQKKLETLQVDFQKNAKQVIDQKTAENLKPYIQEVDRLTQENRNLSDRVEYLYTQWINSQKPNVPKGWSPRATAGREVASFYQKRGIVVDIVNTTMHPDNTISVIFLPKDGNVSSEQLKKGKALECMMVELGLAEQPAMKAHPEGHEIVLKSRDTIYMGVPTVIPLSDPAAKVYNATAFPEHLEYAEPLPDSSARDAAIRELAKAELESQMLNYEPPNEHFDPNQPITDAEINYCRWLYEWREVTTGQPCVKNRNNLIQHLWGVTTGHNSDKRLYQGRTLRERLNQIFDCLGYIDAR